MHKARNWGNRPWSVNFHAPKRELPATVKYAIVGGGFTGLAAAAWLKQLSPESSVALFEAEDFGAGASGHTGGMALDETAAGNLPGLGDVIAGYQQIIRELKVDADLQLPGVYELARTSPLKDSPIRWDDSGTLTAVNRVPGGTINPGKVVTGLASAAHRSGVLLFENTGVESAQFQPEIVLRTSRGAVQVESVLFATNAYSLELTEIALLADPKFTLALATEELSEAALRQVGLHERKPFYTVDLPYLWGRPLGSNSLIFGSGLLPVKHWEEFRTLDIASPSALELFTRLESRIHRLHPAFGGVKITHHWGGPICITEDWKPIFRHHAASDKAIVLGGFSGHGVLQSVYLGAWAAEGLLGRRKLPHW
jgi:glycine/D-amino acid oxidase-like deaminating enzyme